MIFLNLDTRTWHVKCPLLLKRCKKIKNFYLIPRHFGILMSSTIEGIFSKRLKSFIKHPLKKELKSPVIVKGFVCISLQITSNGGVKDGN